MIHTPSYDLDFKVWSWPWHFTRSTWILQIAMLWWTFEPSLKKISKYRANITLWGWIDRWTDVTRWFQYNPTHHNWWEYKKDQNLFKYIHKNFQIKMISQNTHKKAYFLNSKIDFYEISAYIIVQYIVHHLAPRYWKEHAI